MTEARPTRRQFLRRLAYGGLVGVSATAAYASFVEPYSYVITETDVSLRDLPAEFDDFRIVHLTDIHHSRLVSASQVRRVVELANAARPDMAALTGDYTHGRRRYIELCAEALGGLRAPSGVWAVLGNHDHFQSAELTKRALARRGVGVLSNGSTVLRRGRGELQLVGVDDWSWGGADWKRALHNIDRTRPSILLSHQPAVFDLPETSGISLIISGHTHGGQVALPFLGAPARFLDEFRYIGGLYERGGTQLYVSRGTGMVGLPVRFGARPEIALLRLRRDAGRAASESSLSSE